MIRVYVILAMMALSFAAGGFTVHRLYRVDEIRALNSALAEQGEKIRAYELALSERERLRREAESEAAQWRRRWRTVDVGDCGRAAIPADVIRLLDVPADHHPNR